jgi:hypothetical protein
VFGVSALASMISTILVSSLVLINAEVSGRVKTDSGKSYLPLLMPDKTLPSGSPLTRKKYMLAFKAECVR